MFLPFLSRGGGRPRPPADRIIGILIEKYINKPILPEFSRIIMSTLLDKTQSDNLSNKNASQQFEEVIGIILLHRSRASRAVNNELLMTAWQVGGYVSAKIKSEEWGSKVVIHLSEYIRIKRPDLKGYSRRNIYNMMMFYDEYSSPEFAATVLRFLNSEFVQPKTAQLQLSEYATPENQSLTVQTKALQFANQSVHIGTEQMPKILEMTTLTNHIEILSR